MTQRKPLKYRKLRKVLKTFGVTESKKRGKGSERMFVGIVNGRVVTYPTKCHGEGDEKPVAVIEAIRRAFRLTGDNGVTDEDFYAAREHASARGTRWHPPSLVLSRMTRGRNSVHWKCVVGTRLPPAVGSNDR
jgi:hypothetical protein